MKLVDVNGIGPTLAKRLEAAGIDTLQKLVDTDKDELEDIKGLSGGRGRRLQKNARGILSNLDAGAGGEGLEDEEEAEAEVEEAAVLSKYAAYPMQEVAGMDLAYSPCVILLETATMQTREQQELVEDAVDRWNNSNSWPNIFAMTVEPSHADVIINWGSFEIQIVVGSPAHVVLPNEGVTPNQVVHQLGLLLGVSPADNPTSIMGGAQGADVQDYESAALALFNMQQSI